MTLTRAWYWNSYTNTVVLKYYSNTITSYSMHGNIFLVYTDYIDDIKWTPM